MSEICCNGDGCPQCFRVIQVPGQDGGPYNVELNQPGPGQFRVTDTTSGESFVVDVNQLVDMITWTNLDPQDCQDIFQCIIDNATTTQLTEFLQRLDFTQLTQTQLDDLCDIIMSCVNFEVCGSGDFSNGGVNGNPASGQLFEFVAPFSGDFTLTIDGSNISSPVVGSDPNGGVTVGTTPGGSDVESSGPSAPPRVDAGNPQTIINLMGLVEGTTYYVNGFAGGGTDITVDACVTGEQPDTFGTVGNVQPGQTFVTTNGVTVSAGDDYIVFPDGTTWAADATGGVPDITVNAGPTAAVGDDAFGTGSVAPGETIHVHSSDNQIGVGVTDGSAIVDLTGGQTVETGCALSADGLGLGTAAVQRPAPEDRLFDLPNGAVYNVGDAAYSQLAIDVFGVFYVGGGNTIQSIDFGGPVTNVVLRFNDYDGPGGEWLENFLADGVLVTPTLGPGAVVDGTGPNRYHTTPNNGTGDFIFPGPVTQLSWNSFMTGGGGARFVSAEAEGGTFETYTYQYPDGTEELRSRATDAPVTSAAVLCPIDVSQLPPEALVDTFGNVTTNNTAAVTTTNGVTVPIGQPYVQFPDGSTWASDDGGGAADTFATVETATAAFTTTNGVAIAVGEPYILFPNGDTWDAPNVVNTNVTGEHVDNTDPLNPVVLTWIEEECFEFPGAAQSLIGAGPARSTVTISTLGAGPHLTYTAPSDIILDQFLGTLTGDVTVLWETTGGDSGSETFTTVNAGNLPIPFGGAILRAGEVLSITFVDDTPADFVWRNDNATFWDQGLGGFVGGWEGTLEFQELETATVRTYDDGSLFTVDKDGNTVTPLAAIPATWTPCPALKAAGLTCADIITPTGPARCFLEPVAGTLVDTIENPPTLGSTDFDVVAPAPINTAYEFARWTADGPGSIEEVWLLLTSGTLNGGLVTLTVENVTTGQVSVSGPNNFGGSLTPNEELYPVPTPVTVSAGDVIALSLERNNPNPWVLNHSSQSDFAWAGALTSEPDFPAVRFVGQTVQERTYVEAYCPDGGTVSYEVLADGSLEAGAPDPAWVECGDSGLNATEQAQVQEMIDNSSTSTPVVVPGAGFVGTGNILAPGLAPVLTSTVAPDFALRATALDVESGAVTVDDANDQFTVTEDGIYQVTFDAMLQATVATRDIALRLFAPSSVAVSESQIEVGVMTSLSVTAVVSLTAGDTVQPVIASASTSSPAQLFAYNISITKV